MFVVLKVEAFFIILVTSLLATAKLAKSLISPENLKKVTTSEYLEFEAP